MFNTPQFHLLRPAECAALLAVSQSSVYRWLANGKLPAVSMSAGAVRVRSDCLEEFINTHSTTAETPDNINEEATTDAI